MRKVQFPAVVIAIFLWIGFVGAISFLEAWLKFKAPGITVPLGLGIGRLVFNALNKVEWVFAAVILLPLFFAQKRLWQKEAIGLLIPVLILLLQTFWLLPALDARAQLHIDGESVPPSNLHFYFVGMETLKVISLFIYGLRQFIPFAH